MSKTRFSREKSLEMPLSVGIDGFCHKKQKFYVENEVFKRKHFRNAVLRQKRWFLSGKTESLP